MKRAMRPTLAGLAAALAIGKTTARGLAEEALARIDDPAGEGRRAFIHVDAAAVRAAADAQDGLRKAGRAPSAFAGIPYGVKDLFDVVGEVTTAGSKVLNGAVPAASDSDAVARMRAAGFVGLGRTNMTEFAYSGLGLNPHYGTPLSIYDRKRGRIPGGSSAGTGVAIAEGITAFGLGTDTGGSCRLPAVFNGIAGFKPSATRVSKRGVYPLSGSFDSVGPLANTVACCAALDALLAGGAPVRPHLATRLRFGVIRNYLTEGLDETVARDFSAALHKLSAAGHEIVDLSFPALADMPALLANGGIVAAEAWAHHQAMIEAREGDYDPRVASRIRLGAKISAADLAALKARREQMVQAFAGLADGFDAILAPTAAIIPPAIDELAEEAEYRRINGLCLRNTYVFNFLDGCSLSVPMHEEGAAPTGLMLSLPHGGDGRLLAVGQVAEALVA